MNARHNTHYKTTRSQTLALTLIAAVVSLLAACSKNEQAPTMQDAMSGQKAQEVVQAKQVAAAPKGDKSLALSSYQSLNDGKQLMFAYYAAASEPVDYEKIAGVLAPQKYTYETDEFKKRDALNALKPQIDAQVAKAKESKYYKTVIGNGNDIEKYDFETKSFVLKNVPSGNAYQYFTDAASQFHYTFANGEAYKRVKVENEETARKIEGLRTKYGALEIVVYLFAGDTKIGETTLNAEIMRLQIVDKQGNVLLEL